MLYQKSLTNLAKAPDLWAAIGPGSEARSQEWLERQGDGTVQSFIITCRQAYQALDAQWTPMIEANAPLWGREAYPRLSNALAADKLKHDLPIVNAAFTGSGSNFTEAMRQNTAINAFMQARNSMAGGTGAAAIDTFAQTRADIQARNTYNSIAQQAMAWVPILNIVLTVVFFAMFPVIFPAVPHAADRRRDAQGLCDGLLLPGSLGSSLRHPAHDLHDAGRRRRRPGSHRRRRDARQLCRHRGSQWRDGDDRRLHADERAVPRGRPRARRDVDRRPIHVDAGAGAECGRGGRARADHRQLLLWECKLGEFDVEHAAGRPVVDGAELHGRWRRASGGVRTMVPMVTGFGNGQDVIDTSGAISRLGFTPTMNTGTVAEWREMASEAHRQARAYENAANEILTSDACEPQRVRHVERAVLRVGFEQRPLGPHIDRPVRSDNGKQLAGSRGTIDRRSQRSADLTGP